MNNILVPVDFSFPSNHALQEAVKLARVFGARLHVIHVYGAPERVDTKLSVNKLLKREADSQLKQVIHNLEKFSDLELFYKTVRVVDIDRTIQRIANQLHVDLIICGTQGKTSDQDLFLGSVAGALLKKMDTPMLLIPNGHQIEHLQKILFAVNSLEIADEKVLQPLKTFSHYFASDIDFVQIQSQEHMISGDFKGQMIFDLNRTSATVGATNIYEGIAQYLRDQQADILCVIRRK